MNSLIEQKRKNIKVIDLPRKDLRPYVTFSCSSCGKTTNVATETLERYHTVKIKCPCGSVTRYIINRRSAFRKKTSLPVDILVIIAQSSKTPVKATGYVDDISVTGMGIITPTYNSFEIGDVIEAHFELPLNNREKVKKRCVVVCKDDKTKRIGVKFIDSETSDPRIAAFVKS